MCHSRATAYSHLFGIMNPMSFRYLILTAWLSAPAVFAQPADVILHHGKIVTVDPQFRIADTIAIRGDRVIRVGTHSEIIKLGGPNTRQVDLKGKTVLPGLMDSHSHAADASMYEFDHPVPDMETVADVLKYIH